MSSELFTALSDLINTTDDVRALQKEVALIKESIYKTGNNAVQNVLKEQVRANVAKIIEPALSAKPETTLAELEKEMKALPLLRMNIAFQPTQSTIDKVSSWLRTNTEQHWVIDFVVDPEVSAGVVLEVNGFYRDYSLKEKMAQGVQQATKKILNQIAA